MDLGIWMTRPKSGNQNDIMTENIQWQLWVCGCHQEESKRQSLCKKSFRLSRVVKDVALMSSVKTDLGTYLALSC
jgi:hypothetical protein